MVKTNKSKMHLEINNDVELDMNNLTISKRNKKSKLSLKTKAPGFSLKSKPQRKKSNLNTKSSMSKKIKQKNIVFKRISANSKASSAAKSKMTAMKSSLKSSKGRGAKMATPAKKGKRISAERSARAGIETAKMRKMSSGSRLHPAHKKKNLRQGMAKMAKAPRKGTYKSLMAKPKSSKVLKQAKIKTSAREKGGQSLNAKSDSGSIKKVKELWSNLTSSSTPIKTPKGKVTKIAGPAQKRNLAERSSGARIETAKKKRLVPSGTGKHPTHEKNWRRGKVTAKLTAPSSQAPQTRKENEELIADDKSASASNESKTIFMPIQHSSNGNTAEAIVVKMDEDDKKDVDVKDVKILDN